MGKKKGTRVVKSKVITKVTQISARGESESASDPDDQGCGGCQCPHSHNQPPSQSQEDKQKKQSEELSKKYGMDIQIQKVTSDLMKTNPVLREMLGEMMDPTKPKPNVSVKQYKEKCGNFCSIVRIGDEYECLHSMSSSDVAKKFKEAVDLADEYLRSVLDRVAHLVHTEPDRILSTGNPSVPDRILSQALTPKMIRDLLGQQEGTRKDRQLILFTTGRFPFIRSLDLGPNAPMMPMDILSLVQCDMLVRVMSLAGTDEPLKLFVEDCINFTFSYSHFEFGDCCHSSNIGTMEAPVVRMKMLHTAKGRKYFKLIEEAIQQAIDSTECGLVKIETKEKATGKNDSSKVSETSISQSQPAKDDDDIPAFKIAETVHLTTALLPIFSISVINRVNILASLGYTVPLLRVHPNVFVDILRPLLNRSCTMEPEDDLVRFFVLILGKLDLINQIHATPGPPLSIMDMDMISYLLQSCKGDHVANFVSRHKELCKSSDLFEMELESMFNSKWGQYCRKVGRAAEKQGIISRPIAIQADKEVALSTSSQSSSKLKPLTKGFLNAKKPKVADMVKFSSTPRTVISKKTKATMTMPIEKVISTKPMTIIKKYVTPHYDLYKIHADIQSALQALVPFSNAVFERLCQSWSSPLVDYIFEHTPDFFLRIFRKISDEIVYECSPQDHTHLTLMLVLGRSEYINEMAVSSPKPLSYMNDEQIFLLLLACRVDVVLGVVGFTESLCDAIRTLRAEADKAFSPHITELLDGFHVGFSKQANFLSLINSAERMGIKYTSDKSNEKENAEKLMRIDSGSADDRLHSLVTLVVHRLKYLAEHSPEVRIYECHPRDLCDLIYAATDPATKDQKVAIVKSLTVGKQHVINDVEEKTNEGNRVKGTIAPKKIISLDEMEGILSIEPFDPKELINLCRPYQVKREAAAQATSTLKPLVKGFLNTKSTLARNENLIVHCNDSTNTKSEPAPFTTFTVSPTGAPEEMIKVTLFDKPTDVRISKPNKTNISTSSANTMREGIPATTTTAQQTLFHKIEIVDKKTEVTEDEEYDPVKSRSSLSQYGSLFKLIDDVTSTISAKAKPTTKARQKKKSASDTDSGEYLSESDSKHICVDNPRLRMFSHSIIERLQVLSGTPTPTKLYDCFAVDLLEMLVVPEKYKGLVPIVDVMFYIAKHKLIYEMPRNDGFKTRPPQDIFSLSDMDNIMNGGRPLTDMQIQSIKEEGWRIQALREHNQKCTMIDEKTGNRTNIKEKVRSTSTSSTKALSSSSKPAAKVAQKQISTSSSVSTAKSTSTTSNSIGWKRGFLVKEEKLTEKEKKTVAVKTSVTPQKVEEATAVEIKKNASPVKVEDLLLQVPVELPPAVKCSLCSASQIQPTTEVFYRATCSNDCILMIHKQCLHEIMTARKLKKKKELKDQICFTNGCDGDLLSIFETSMANEESIYFKCSEKKVLPAPPEAVKTEKKKKEKGARETPVRDTVKDTGKAVEPVVNQSPVNPPPMNPEAQKTNATPAAPVMAKREIPIAAGVPVKKLERPKDEVEAKYDVSGGSTHQKKQKHRRNEMQVTRFQTGFQGSRDRPSDFEDTNSPYVSLPLSSSNNKKAESRVVSKSSRIESKESKMGQKQTSLATSNDRHHIVSDQSQYYGTAADPQLPINDYQGGGFPDSADEAPIDTIEHFPNLSREVTEEQLIQKLTRPDNMKEILLNTPNEPQEIKELLFTISTVLEEVLSLEDKKTLGEVFKTAQGCRSFIEKLGYFIVNVNVKEDGSIILYSQCMLDKKNALLPPGACGPVPSSGASQATEHEVPPCWEDIEIEQDTYGTPDATLDSFEKDSLTPVASQIQEKDGDEIMKKLLPPGPIERPRPQPRTTDRMYSGPDSARSSESTESMYSATSTLSSRSGGSTTREDVSNRLQQSISDRERERQEKEKAQKEIQKKKEAEKDLALIQTKIKCDKRKDCKEMEKQDRQQPNTATIPPLMSYSTPVADIGRTAPVRIPSLMDLDFTASNPNNQYMNEGQPNQQMVNITYDQNGGQPFSMFGTLEPPIVKNDEKTLQKKLTRAERNFEKMRQKCDEQANEIRMLSIVEDEKKQMEAQQRKIIKEHENEITKLKAKHAKEIEFQKRELELQQLNRSIEVKKKDDIVQQLRQEIRRLNKELDEEKQSVNILNKALAEFRRKEEMAANQKCDENQKTELENCGQRMKIIEETKQHCNLVKENARMINNTNTRRKVLDEMRKCIHECGQALDTLTTIEINLKSKPFEKVTYPACPQFPTSGSELLSLLMKKNEAAAADERREMLAILVHEFTAIKNYLQQNSSSSSKIPHDEELRAMIKKEIQSQKNRWRSSSGAFKFDRDAVVQQIRRSCRSRLNIKPTSDSKSGWQKPKEEPAVNRVIDWQSHDCTICLHRFKEDRSDAEVCNHCVEPYHSWCIKEWLRINSICPRCKTRWPDWEHFPNLS